MKSWALLVTGTFTVTWWEMSKKSLSQRYWRNRLVPWSQTLHERFFSSNTFFCHEGHKLTEWAPLIFCVEENLQNQLLKSFFSFVSVSCAERHSSWTVLTWALMWLHDCMMLWHSYYQNTRDIHIKWLEYYY